jgi:hypothetical protein
MMMHHTLLNSVTVAKIVGTGTGKSVDDGSAKKIRADYDAKLSVMQTEVRKLQAAKREHTKLLRNQTHHEAQLKTLKNDLIALKQMKVCIGFLLYSSMY